MSKDKYETHLFTGIVVEQDLSGNYVPKDGATLHRWRTGKHTKGKYKHTGQVFLTENHQSVAVLSQEKWGLEFLVLESISIPKVLGPF